MTEVLREIGERVVALSFSDLKKLVATVEAPYKKEGWRLPAWDSLKPVERMENRDRRAAGTPYYG